MRVIFMGTPEFAVPCLREILTCHQVAAVVTQPDKEKGRGKKMQFPPVKEFAVAHNIPVLQPEKVKNAEAELREYQADVFIVVAYGQLLPETILNIPKYGCINVHGSLLPKYRGAAPIQWAVINGEQITGVTIMHMDKGLDTGDMILKAEIEVSSSDTAGSLHDKMSEVGAQALITALEQISAGTAAREKQCNEQSSYAPMLTKELGHINWDESCEKIVNLVRGLNPWPAAYSVLEQAPLKIWHACKMEEYSVGQAGEIVDITPEGFVVKASDGGVLIDEIQAQGGKRMSAADYMRGHTLVKGTLLK